MLQQKDIIRFIKEKDVAVKASEIALGLGKTKKEINSKLYKMEHIVVSKTETTPYYWSLLSLEEQVLNTLKSRGVMVLLPEK